MKEREFHVKTIHKRKDDKGFVSLIITCHEGEDMRIILNCGPHQVRFVELNTPEGIFYECDGA